MTAQVDLPSPPPPRWWGTISFIVSGRGNNTHTQHVPCMWRHQSSTTCCGLFWLCWEVFKLWRDFRFYLRTLLSPTVTQSETWIKLHQWIYCSLQTYILLTFLHVFGPWSQKFLLSQLQCTNKSKISSSPLFPPGVLENNLPQNIWTHVGLSCG